MAQAGAGGQVFASYAGAAAAANITNSKPSGLGNWSDAQIERAIRTGISADGRKLVPVMPFASYNGISVDDMTALIAYLRSLPPVD